MVSYTLDRLISNGTLWLAPNGTNQGFSTTQVICCTMTPLPVDVMLHRWICQLWLATKLPGAADFPSRDFPTLETRQLLSCRPDFRPTIMPRQPSLTEKGSNTGSPLKALIKNFPLFRYRPHFSTQVQTPKQSVVRLVNPIYSA